MTLVKLPIKTGQYFAGLAIPVLFAVIALSPNAALAATGCDSSAAAISGGTLGEVICNVVISVDRVPGLFSGLSYLIGIILGVFGIEKLYKHVNNPHQTEIWESLKRFLAGGAMFALPMMIEVAQTAFFPDDSGAIDGTSWNGQTTGSGLDEMLVSLVRDTMGPMSGLLWAFCYLAGLIFIMIGIMRLLKTAQEGPRGPGGIGTIMTFLIGGALLSVDQMLGSWSQSLFGTEQVTHYAELSFTTGMAADELNHVMAADELNHVHAVISAVLGFVMILGWISFVRGWFILRDVAEGNGQASMMAALTHLFGGALAVNLGPVLNAVQDTFGLTSVGIGFR